MSGNKTIGTGRERSNISFYRSATLIVWSALMAAFSFLVCLMTIQISPDICSLLLLTTILFFGIGIIGIMYVFKHFSRIADLRDIRNQKIVEANEILTREIETRRQTERQLTIAQAALEDASDAIIILNPDLTVAYVNMAFGLRFQVTNENIGSFDWLSIFRDRQEANESIQSAAGGSNIKQEFELVTANTHFPARIGMTLILDDEFEQLGILVIITDITEEKALEDKLKELATLDGLTGLYNRRSFDERLSDEWVRAKRAKTPLGIIMFDIDYFKTYNDTYGHQQGDACLIKVANVLKLIPNRPFDFVARYGGEEFVCLLPETDGKGTKALAERMRNAVIKLQLPHASSSVNTVVTVSAGYCNTVPDDDHSSEIFLHCADKGLYKSKSLGRNRVSAGSLNEEEE